MGDWSRVSQWKNYFDEFRKQTRQSSFEYTWDSYRKWRDATTSFLSATESELLACLEANRPFYRSYIDDLEAIDWNHFRPLRLSREEDFSDWLCHFLEHASTADFVKRVLKLDKGKRVIGAKRETSNDGYRSDILLEFADKTYAHIEVKIGDKHIEKTYETSLAMMKHYGTSKESMENYILLMSEQIDAWQGLEKSNWQFGIEPITWEEIAIAARQSAYFSQESLLWKTWILGFIGIIETKLLRLPNGHSSIGFHNLSESNKKIQILTEAING